MGVEPHAEEVSPQDHLLAMAGKPIRSRIRAEPASQALGSTNPRPLCNARKAAAFPAAGPLISRVNTDPSSLIAVSRDSPRSSRRCGARPSAHAAV